jgi:hypothetical protein
MRADSRGERRIFSRQKRMSTKIPRDSQNTYKIEWAILPVQKCLLYFVAATISCDLTDR